MKELVRTASRNPRTLDIVGGGSHATAALLFALIALYPLVTIVTLVLVIPLLMYVTDHTPFQSLNPLRPDHFARLVVRVYTAWLSNPGGKMKAKDL